MQMKGMVQSNQKPDTRAMHVANLTERRTCLKFKFNVALRQQTT